ncbi:MAG: protein-L-isoaspartate O-methyltransferase, partial [Gammaproteobacteria bacterium]|nr:protein-L-isoaspartate O-methyltransferase [Gammaproteobacteria bacterium]
IRTTDAMHWDAAGDSVGRHGFDAICVTGAVATLPVGFAQWLRPGGRLFVVHGQAPAMEAALLRRDSEGLRTQSLFETELSYLAGAVPVPRFQL